MALSRVSTYAYNQRVISDYGRVQSELVQINRQMSSGRIAEVFQDLNGRVEKVNAYENKLKTTEQYLDSNNVVLARLETMSISAEDIIRLTDEAINLVVQSLGATEAQYPVFRQAMIDKINSVAANLNVNIGGSYLFAGGKSDRPPVTVPVPDNSVGPTTNYYQGDDETLTARASDNLLMDYGVTAADPAYRDLLAAMNRAVTALANGNISGLQESLGMLNVASDQVNAVKANISGNIVILRDANNFHDSTIAYLKGVYGENISTDMVTASTELAINNGILQATFQAFSRISSLNLTSYLR